MYEIEFTNQAEKDLKLCGKRGYKKDDLNKVVEFLIQDGNVPPKFKPHRLSGTYAGIWECHIKGDWVLLWIIVGNTVKILRTGTHSDLL